MNFVALDFETANHSWSSICSVGLAVVKGGNIVERVSWLVRPPDLYFHPVFTGIHGIGPEDVQDKPDFNKLWSSVLKDYLMEKTVIAHNAGFDINVLRHTMSKYLIPYPGLSYQCSVVIARKTWPCLGSYKLKSLAKLFGIDFRHHDASEDAFACAKIVLEAGAAVGANSFNELVNKLHINVKEFTSR